MRVLFVTLPAKAHLYAQVPLAWALRAAGHEVCVASQPDLAEAITAAGLTAVPVGRVMHQEAVRTQGRRRREELEERGEEVHPFYLEWERELDIAEFRPERLTPEYMHGVLLIWTFIFQNTSPPEMIEDLVGFARAWRPDLLIADTTVFAGAIAARASGAVHARLLYGLDLVGHMRQKYLEMLSSLPWERRDDPVREWLTPILAGYGCEFGEDVVLGQWSIDPTLPSMRLAVDHHYLPMRFVPYNGPAKIPDWLREPPKRQRACLTLGLSLREILGKDRVSVAMLLEAVGGLDAEVVATLDANQLAGAQVPGNVRAVDFVPLNELLPSCSAIIHQGGFGQAQNAIAHGIPQIMLPNGYWDTMPRARRVHDAGAGLCVADAERMTAAELRRQLEAVLADPSFAKGAHRLRTEMLGTPAPAEVARTIEALVANRA
jgi:glycosyltransferase (activator-dependent family)